MGPRPRLCVGIVLSVAGIGRSAYAFRDHLAKIVRSERPFYLAHLEPELRDALFWIKANTPARCRISGKPRA